MKGLRACMMAATTMTMFACGALAQTHPDFSTTVDFLDYVFFDKMGPADVYPLEVYEQRLKEIADVGFKRVMLRVNCCGVTLYPTKVTRLYGEGFAWHWDMPEQSKRLTKTVRTYDVCAETIRLCHKYGMEAYAWESLGDGGSVSMPNNPKKYGDMPRLSRCAPCVDPFFFDHHMECYAMRDPRLSPRPEQVRAVNEAARKYPITKIVCTELVKRPPLRITADTIVIWTSDDNSHYTRYDKPFKFESGVTEDGMNTFTLSDLDIKANFVKFGHRVPFDKEHDTYTFAMRGKPDQMQVYNSQGEKIVASWHANLEDTVGEDGCLNLFRFDSTGWDYDKREIGFEVGLTYCREANYHIGVPEYNVPLAMKHQLERFAELAAYPFDGYMMNLRSHSWVSKPEEFGFNPEVREIYLKRYGKDIWREDYELGKLMLIRAEGIAKFYKGCKALCGDRPFWVSCVPPARLGTKSEEKVFRGMGTHLFGWIPSLYKTYFRDGSVDGIMMIGGDFSDYFTDEVTEGRDVKLGIFRECGGHLANNRYYYPEGYDFEADMKKLYNHPRISTIELYETLEFTNNAKKREILRKLIKGE